MPDECGSSTFSELRTRPVRPRCMPTAHVLAVVLVFLAAVADAASFRTRLDEANGLLRRGDVDGAITAYRDLQTDKPESALLYYDIGCAQFERAVSEAELEAAEDASASFEEAKASFDKALTVGDPELRKKAQFNSANCSAQIAKQAVAAQQYDKTVEAFTASVQQYEDFLRLYPYHEDARKNLDHMRYLLKKMLQNPPPPPEQQQGEGEQSDEQDQQQSEGQSQESEAQDEQQQAQEESEQQDQPSEQEQQQTGEQQASETQEEDQPSEDEESAQPEDRQNVEAILQSLEDMDNREMHDTMDEDERRAAPRESDWW